jgi:competence protein ComEC
MGFGLRWILLVAGYVANFEGAKGYVAGPSPLVLPVLSIGAFWLILWQGRLRYIGLVMMAASFMIWARHDRPLVLIADNGSLLGVMTDQGRALSKEKGAGFVARNWLENDGDPSSQLVAASLWGTGMKRSKVAQVGAYEFVHLIGKKAVSKFDRCQSDQIVIASVETQRDFGNCTVHDPKTLRNSGSIGLYLQGDEAVFITARDISGDRIWSAWPSNQPSKKADQKTRPILK